MDGIDLSSWVGKPPEKAESPGEPEEAEEDTIEVTATEHIEAETSARDISSAPDEQAEPSASEGSSDFGDILHDEADPKKRGREDVVPKKTNDISSDAGDEDDDEALPIELFQKHLYIDVPKLSEEEKETYDYLPGHFSVKRVLYQQKDKRYVVRLESGEQDIVSPLCGFHLICYFT